MGVTEFRIFYHARGRRRLAARRRAGSRVRALILDASGVNTIDSSAALSLRTILEQVRQVSVETAAPLVPMRDERYGTREATEMLAIL